MNNLFYGTESIEYNTLDDGEEYMDLYDEGLDEYYEDEIDNEENDLDFLLEDELDIYYGEEELAEALREAIHEDYQDAPSEEIEDALFDILAQLSPAEEYNYKKALGHIAKSGKQILQNPTVRQIAKKALPAAGTAIGTIYGGPAGAMIGGKLGQVAGQAISSAGKKSSSPVTTPKTTQTSPQNGSIAAAQLLQLTQNPDMLKSLLALALGSHGKNSVSVGKDTQSSVPVGAFMNLLGILVSQAASDAEELLGESNESSSYLLDSEGEYLVDPVVPEDRAKALYETLMSAQNLALAGESISRQPWSNYLPFAKGTKLLVEYETILRDFDIGSGYIHERTSNLLKAKIHINKWETFNVPETYVMLLAEYAQDGPGNKAVIIVNGKQYIDENVIIRSGQSSREIFLSTNFLGQKVDQITISRESSNKAKLKFKAGKDQHVLVLTKD